MLSYVRKPTGTKEQGVVTEVDTKNFRCKVKTARGFVLTNVPWQSTYGGSNRMGDVGTPTMGDVVVVSLELGFPLITGFIPMPYHEDEGVTPLSASEYGAPETGDFSLFRLKGFRGNRSAGKDILIGDRRLTSEGGGLFSMLAGGGALLKASGLAQVLLTKFDDLVRVVSRNFEVFTAGWVDYTVQKSGSVYRFLGYGKDHADLRADRYRYQEITGDCVTGDALQDNHLDGEVSSRDDVIRLEKVVKYMNDSDSGHTDTKYVLYSGKLNLDGSFVEQTTNDDGSEKHEKRSSRGESWSKVTGSGGYSQVTWTSTMVLLDFNNQATVTLSSSGIVADWNNTAKLELNDSNAKLSFGSHFVRAHAGGVEFG